MIIGVQSTGKAPSISTESFSNVPKRGLHSTEIWDWSQSATRSTGKNIWHLPWGPIKPSPTRSCAQAFRHDEEYEARSDRTRREWPPPYNSSWRSLAPYKKQWWHPGWTRRGSWQRFELNRYLAKTSSERSQMRHEKAMRNYVKPTKNCVGTYNC